MRLSERVEEPPPYRAPESGGSTTLGEPSATDAVERVLDAGQRLVSGRIELVKLDVQDALTERIARGALIVVPALFAFGGWWMLMAALATLLNDHFTPAVSLSIVGGVHVALGGGIALATWTHVWSPDAVRDSPPKGTRP